MTKVSSRDILWSSGSGLGIAQKGLGGLGDAFNAARFGVIWDGNFIPLHGDCLWANPKAILSVVVSPIPLPYHGCANHNVMADS